MKQMIVYNDETKRTKDFVDWYKKNYSKAVENTPKKYSWGMYRLEVADIKNTLNAMLKEQNTKFTITDHVTHHHNIGNNNLFEIKYSLDRESVEFIICKLALNSDMFGGVYHYIEDLSGKVLCK